MIDTFFSRLPKPTSEGGFTLIELLISTLLGLVVFGAILGTLETSQQVQARDTEWALTLQEGRAGLARMAREIRQASEIKTHEAGTIEFLATIGGAVWKIKYECGVAQSGTEYHECVRKAVEKSTGTLPSSGTPVVRDVLNPNEVYSYSPNATASWTAATAYVANATVKTSATGYASYVCIKAMASGEDVEPPEATHWRLLANAVTLKVELPAKGTLKQAGSSGYTHSVVLENAAFMRNLDLEG